MPGCRNGFPTGGRSLGADDHFIEPAIVVNPPDDSRVVAEEPFGTVLRLLEYGSVDEVDRRVNATPYWLAASIWTEVEVATRAIADQLQCGTVWTNEAHMLSPLAPFGGHQQFGIGAESVEERLPRR